MARCRACDFVRPRVDDPAEEARGWDCPGCKRSLDPIGRPYAERVVQDDQVLFRDRKTLGVQAVLPFVGVLGLVGIASAAITTGLALLSATGASVVVVTWLLLALLALVTLGSVGGVAGLVAFSMRAGMMREIGVGPLKLAVEGATYDFAGIDRLEGTGDDFAVVLQDGQRLDIGWMAGVEEELRPALERFRTERVGDPDDQAEDAQHRARLAAMAAERARQ